MMHPQTRIPGGASLKSAVRASTLAAVLLALPVVATAQAPAGAPPPPPPENTPAQTSAPAPQTQEKQDKQAKQSPQKADTQAQKKKVNPEDLPPIPQLKDPQVKPGSEADVSAIGNRNVGKGLDFYSLQKEIALGKSLAQQVERSAKLIQDPVVDEYVNRVGQNLVRNSDARVPFTIKVIDSDQVNAFALPGGFFYVNSGLILRASDEAELAGVMAHEIAHVAARHATKNATRSTIAQLATIPLIMLGPGGWAGYGLYQGLNFAIPLSFLKFSRDEERQADYLGLQYMYKAGYDPNAFVSFFEKIEADEKRQPGTVSKLFSTHPPTPERVKNIEKEIATILPARSEYIEDTSDFDRVRARLNRIENRSKLRDKSPNRPTLRTRTQQQPGSNTGSNGNPSESDPGRPTLKRRTQAPENPQP